MSQFENSAVNEFNLRNLYTLILKRLWLIFLITILFTAMGWLFIEYNNKSPKYQASTNIIIDAEAEYRNTLQVVIKDITVLESVIRELRLEKSSEDLAKQVKVESIEDTQVVKISVVDKDPILAADIANTTVRAFKERVPDILDINGVSILSEAKAQSKPMQHNQVKIILASLILGIVTGLALIFLMDYFDNTIKSEAEIEKILGIQVLGSVSQKKKRRTKRKKKRTKELHFRSETIGIR
ncbi:MAG TPA: capsular biosynthesis protein [Bacillus bacterium]|uniref:Capsular polysaccharide biosynthesis protein YwqC n=1 Tax=Siminovitchia fordii TaxID=254759 RepID=A0ABQ4K5E7_9BACI|nr:Wzz/FepE/Etk N-terminal domain-containing protein [Siminovitchia fordii]GIN20949.1 putative capsular polysaccharide biosynthesis protein YwqC [Siminovitchia fordii]HBZ12114.1 capsular biosynthesis protein [Bacillus sp. (in: firmicutes)]